jgi:predicted dehydrogenase
MSSSIRVLVVGAGHMGTSHAKAYDAIPEFEICGIVTRGDSGLRLAESMGSVDHFRDFDVALKTTAPDAVAIASFTETHVRFATQALVAGHILRHHPSWKTFVDLAKGLGKPLVMRMNLNQQSDGSEWSTHRSIMAITSPIVDCGVHYVDVMRQMTGSRVTRVHAIGARLSDEIDSDMYNYGQLQMTFEDGSVGWYEAGWGPMMSETAFFIKDVCGPKGAISIESGLESSAGSSSDVDGHSATNRIRRHHAQLGADGVFVRGDDLIETSDEPDHDALCRLEQEWFLEAIRGRVDLTQHLEDVVESQRIVLAADESIRTGEVVAL